jgi:D-beta-D-heptose 7-phosphate kinase/D-beta-D-heptose 1-phosphate adenosyltransferase
MYKLNKTFIEAPQSTIDVSGAGDTFMAALAFKYMQTKNIEESIVFANQIASIVVSKKGVSTI